MTNTYRAVSFPILLSFSLSAPSLVTHVLGFLVLSRRVLVCRAPTPTPTYSRQNGVNSNEKGEMGNTMGGMGVRQNAIGGHDGCNGIYEEQNGLDCIRNAIRDKWVE